MNKDVIVYCAMDHGVDGRAPGRVMYASLDEAMLNKQIAADPNRAWRTIQKKVVNLAALKVVTMKNLDGVQRLALEVA